jgi:hypothetical protein
VSAATGGRRLPWIVALWCAVTGSAEALTAYRLICALAEENASALDAPLRLMAQNAWIGGGAQGFADDLASQRRGMQQAWADAIEEAARLVAHTGVVLRPAGGRHRDERGAGGRA